MSSLTKWYNPFSLQRKAITDNSFTSSNIYEDVGTYSGFIQPVSGGESFRDGKGGENATHRLYTDIQTPGLYGDRVIYDGQSYLVLYATQPGGISNVGHHKEIILGIFE